MRLARGGPVGGEGKPGSAGVEPEAGARRELRGHTDLLRVVFGSVSPRELGVPSLENPISFEGCGLALSAQTCLFRKH